MRMICDNSNEEGVKEDKIYRKVLKLLESDQQQESERSSGSSKHYQQNSEQNNGRNNSIIKNNDDEFDLDSALYNNDKNAQSDLLQLLMTKTSKSESEIE